MDWMEAEELAATVLGIDEQPNLDSDAIEQALADKFGCSLEDFQKIATALIPFTLPARSALTGDVYQGFVNVMDGSFIVKQPAAEKVRARVAGASPAATSPA